MTTPGTTAIVQVTLARPAWVPSAWPSSTTSTRPPGEAGTDLVDRDAYLTRHALARLTLGRLLAREPGELRFTRDCPTCAQQHGKPRLGGDSRPLAFSLSGTTSSGSPDTSLVAVAVVTDLLPRHVPEAMSGATSGTMSASTSNRSPPRPSRARRRGAARLRARRRRCRPRADASAVRAAWWSRKVVPSSRSSATAADRAGDDRDDPAGCDSPAAARTAPVAPSRAGGPPTAALPARHRRRRLRPRRRRRARRDRARRPGNTSPTRPDPAAHHPAGRPTRGRPRGSGRSSCPPGGPGARAVRVRGATARRRPGPCGPARIRQVLEEVPGRHGAVGVLGGPAADHREERLVGEGAADRVDRQRPALVDPVVEHRLRAGVGEHEVLRLLRELHASAHSAIVCSRCGPTTAIRRRSPC